MFEELIRFLKSYILSSLYVCCFSCRFALITYWRFSQIHIRFKSGAALIFIYAGISWRLKVLRFFWKMCPATAAVHLGRKIEQNRQQHRMMEYNCKSPTGNPNLVLFHSRFDLVEFEAKKSKFPPPDKAPPRSSRKVSYTVILQCCCLSWAKKSSCKYILKRILRNGAGETPGQFGHPAITNTLDDLKFGSWVFGALLVS